MTPETRETVRNIRILMAISACIACIAVACVAHVFYPLGGVVSNLIAILVGRAAIRHIKARPGA